MSPEAFGRISGGIVILSTIPYLIRTYQGKISQKLSSWYLWLLIGLALLVTYKSSGALSNLWPAIFGFTNPLLITIVSWWKNAERGKLDLSEKICLPIGIASLVLWVCVYDNKELSQLALYLAILADACAAVPTFMYVKEDPSRDRPGAWVLFAIGYGVAFFAIEEHTFANYVLPAWMVLGPLIIATPLIAYRCKMRAPIKEWM